MPDGAPFHADLAGAPPGTAAHFADAGAARIRFACTQPGKRGIALILPGRTEYAEKYGEVMSRLAGMGFGCVVIDWRGQGLSTRPPQGTGLGHVGDFAEYQLDLAAVLVHPAVQAMPGPRVMFAHSMGGCIGWRALDSGLAVRAAVFSAPMWGLTLPLPLRLLGPLMARAACALGLGARHAPGDGPGFYVLEQPFDGNLLTGDPERYGWMQAHLRSRPELGLGGPSFAWARAAFAEMAALARTRPPALPVLGFLGGQEGIVSPAAIRARFARLTDARLVELAAARHEIWMERPAIREEVWRETEGFLESVGI
ncbi:MAG: alpha/beta hydrolase [Alphaproteobacteria bacterium]|nr:MAG: alpha/beta hydrolase [Alphaproteobacteria bacterium]